MRNSFLLLGTALLATLSGAAAQAQTYQQVWADEFTGTSVKAANWVFETGNPGANNELEYYQAANATVANGNLMITAKKENVGGWAYTSARMTTQGLRTFTYGKMEARIKMPLGKGLWPAFWMLGSNITTVGWPKCGEIDIMEHVNDDNFLYATEHYDDGVGYKNYGTSTTTATPGNYHVYTVEWDANLIKTSVDGVPYHWFTIANNVGSTEEFHKSFFLLLNLAVGGDFPNQPVDESKLPATMYVDYVRVYKLVAPAPAAALTLQAEAANVNVGMVVEPCSEGGQDMGFIDANDYLVFDNVNFPTTGTYKVEYRVASATAGGTISCDLNAGAVQLGSTTVPGTGGWQTWTTVSRTVTVNAGTYNLGVFAQTGGYNLNWIRITKVSARGVLAAASAATDGPALTLYPNPVTDRLTLQAGPAFLGGEVRIMGIDGRLVWRGTHTGATVDVTALSPGLYTLTAQNQAGDKLVRRFSKQ